MKGRDHLRKLDVDRIILKWVPKIYFMKMWIVLFRTGGDDELFEQCHGLRIPQNTCNLPADRLSAF
jgi:hypothetical protein